MIERILIVILLAAAALVLYRLCTQRQMRKAAASTRDPLLNDVQPGIPTIVYFTTPTCAPCRLQQTPTLQRLQEEFGTGLRVIRVDASEDPEAADRWGVFSVPTTFVLDPKGTPRQVFNGVVDALTLRRELQIATNGIVEFSKK